MLAFSNSAATIFDALHERRPVFEKKISNITVENVTVATQLCHICGEDDVDGITCPQNHYMCNSCMTSYVRSLNEDPADSKFHQRQGRIFCPSNC